MAKKLTSLHSRRRKVFKRGQLNVPRTLRHNMAYDGSIFDLHWKSAYYAPAYDPAIQQFYNQDILESPAFPLVDVFFNARIKRARVFFKYNNVMQILYGTGYFPTPFYPGQRNIFDFGFDWSFYD